MSEMDCNNTHHYLLCGQFTHIFPFNINNPSCGYDLPYLEMRKMRLKLAKYRLWSR